MFGLNNIPSQWIEEQCHAYTNRNIAKNVSTILNQKINNNNYNQIQEQNLKS